MAEIKDIESEYMNTSRMANLLTNNTDYIALSKGLPFKITAFDNEKSKKRIDNIVSICQKEELSFTDTALNRFDLSVMDSVYTIWVHGNQFFTPEMLLKVLYADFDLRSTDQKIEAVEESLFKMSCIHVLLDLSAEWIARKKIKEGEKFTLESNLLHLIKCEYTAANNKTVKAYQILTEPILYRYASQIGQIVKVPVNDLKLPEKTRGDQEAIQIKRYLIKRIEGMKNTKNHLYSNTIAYEWIDRKDGFKEKGLFNTLGYDKTQYKKWGNKKAKIRKTILTILDDLKDSGYITDYKETKSGREFTGIKITI